MNGQGTPLIEDAVRQLQQLSDQTGDWVVERFYQAHPEVLEKFGPRGRQICRQDMDHHLRFLLAALESGSPGFFTNYIQWLASVLENRGLPTEHLQDSLRLIDDFITTCLTGDTAVPIRQLLNEGIAALEKERPALPAFYRYLPEPAPESRSFTTALLEGNRLTAQAIAGAKLHAGSNLIDLGVEVVQPALYEIGQLWQINRASVAQEHLATAICQNILARAFMHAEMAPPCDRKALFSCVEGNHHSLGLRMVSDAFELQGWEVAYLGADTPTPALLAQIEQWRPDIVGLSLALPHHIAVARTIIDRCHSQFGARCPVIMIGGLAINTVDNLWKRIGADVWCPDARTARREAA